MKTQVLLAHAKGEEKLAEQLAAPLRAAGYEVTHEGTLLIGESVVAEMTKLLGAGAPLVICGSMRAMGSSWTRKLANAARALPGTRLFAVQMEEDADVEAVTLDEKIACYWQNPAKAEQDLLAALGKYYPPDSGPQQNLRAHDLESRYRHLALKACDIIDLANLPEDDRHLAARELELRRLYVALRMRLEIQAGDAMSDETLEALEKRRAATWGSSGRRDDEEKNLVSLGERLQAARRLVVLGDPGAGKSTLLRWLATAYLLRLQNDADWRELPDIASLPDDALLPILIRCRDLPPQADTLDAMLQHSLRKSEMAENECHALRELLRDRLQAGSALLLVDGLDEITEPSARARFAQQLEQIHRVYPAAPMVVTSRIVGYREMGQRIRCGFEHLTVADLSRQDKDDFARRWCGLTEPAERRAAAAAELIRDIHSSDRIERLTGNPMLLTTMALIKRKIGRLPQRRVDLYEKAVEVLLNWRSVVDTPLDPREALPQLEYLAHAMCSDGVQQIREDQALALLRQARTDYPNIHAMQQHSPEAFLALLESRTGLLIQSGHTRHNGYSVAVYEFRHLTFQEYLAGLALVQGHYRGRNPGQTLAQAIAPLAGQVGESEFGPFADKETAVVENWREALRLCLATCNDSDVDAALLAILRPLPEETSTARARAVLAALCLADEPNVSQTLAQEVLQRLAEQVRDDDGGGRTFTSLDAAAMELAASRWTGLLGEYLLDEFFRSETEQRVYPGGLYGMVRETQAPTEAFEFSAWLAQQAVQLAAGNESEAAAVALTVMTLTFRGKNCQVPGVADGLVQRLAGSAPMSHAAAWALAWMNTKQHEEPAWHPNPGQLEQLLAAAGHPGCDSEALRWLSEIFQTERTPLALDALLPHLLDSLTDIRRAIVETLGAIGDSRATAALLARLQDVQEDQGVRQAAATALGQIGDTAAIEGLQAYLQTADESLRRAALGGLAQCCQDPTDHKLLSTYLDEYVYSDKRWLDPRAPINAERIAHAAEKLKKTPEEIRQRYAALTERFGLTLE
jgi:HEAT repeat protein